jgi:hypothetical protein
MTRATRSTACAALLVFASANVLALDGISVTTHWTGDNNMGSGGWGEIWRHDIQAGAVVSSTKLTDGPGRNQVISPDGTRVAFVTLFTAKICVVSINGGPVTELADSHIECCLDWPSGDWIYYNMGGPTNAPSAILRRVNAVSKTVEDVVTWDHQVWRFGIASDLRRACARTTDDGTSTEPYDTIVAYDMLSDGSVFRTDRAVPRPSCGNGMDPEGVYFTSGDGSHTIVDIRRWDNLSVVSSFTLAQSETWGGMPSGNFHNRNSWSVNSGEWLCLHVGWGDWQGTSGANQVLVNWATQERIVVSANLENSYTFDCAGDLWVSGGSPPPAATPSISPNGGTFDAPVQITLATSTSGATIRYTVDGTQPTEASPAYSASFTLGESATAMARAYAAGMSPSAVASASFTISAEPVNQPPIVSAGVDQNGIVGEVVNLYGSASDDGLPYGTLTVTWSVVVGNAASVAIADPSSASTSATFAAEGDYSLRLTADDGELERSDTVSVQVGPPPSIDLFSPVGGEAWYAGATRYVLWSTEGIGNVTILYSTSGGASWNVISATTESPGSGLCYHAWVVPDEPSMSCFVTVSDYLGTIEVQSPAAFEIRGISDWDEDGMDDGWEIEHFSNLGCTASGDEDGDGLCNLDEFLAAADPTMADTDSDGMPDNWEVSNSLDPTFDDAAADPDLDGRANLAEFQDGSDPWSIGSAVGGCRPAGQGSRVGVLLSLGMSLLLARFCRRKEHSTDGPRSV